MTFGGTQRMFAAAVILLIGALGTQVGLAQGSAAQNPPMADDVFTNVRVLKGLTVSQFMDTMGFISASLGYNCSDCHQSENDWAAYALDNPTKNTARRMLAMVSALNENNFGGRRMVTCYTCHRGDQNPRVTPTIAGIYSVPPPVEPDDIVKDATNAPPAAQILDKYLQALGGAQRVAAITSLVAKGTYKGYSAEEGSTIVVDIYAKSPMQRSQFAHTLNGDLGTTYDGTAAYSEVPGAPVPVLALTDEHLEGAKLDALLSFPAGIKTMLSDWKVGFPVDIGGSDADVVQGRLTRTSLPVKLYFDQKSGLLVRQVRYSQSPLGRNVTQVDYSDYRTVNGVKMPFHIVTSWFDGRGDVQLTQIQANTAIDPAKFGKPAPPTPPK
jgi:hypothetical protein